MNKAFTLVETLIAMALVGILIGVGASVSYKATQREQVDQAGQKLQTAYETARAYALAGKKVSCIGSTDRLSGWGVDVQANSFTLEEFCNGNFSSGVPYGSAVNYSPSGNVTLVTPPSANPIIFRPLGLGVYTSGGFSSPTSAVLGGSGFQKEIDISPQGQISPLALVLLSTPTPTTVPPTPTNTVAPTPTNTVAPTATPTAAAPTPTPTPSFNSGMVAYWKLNEVSGSPADSAGANTSTLVNSPTQNAAGKFNSAITFNGTNQYMTFDGVHVGPGTAYTIVFWFKTTSTVKSKVYYEASSTVSTQAVYVSVNENVTGDLEYGTYDNTGVWSGVATGAVGLNNGAWHQVVVVQQSKSSRQLFVDGVSIGTSSVTLGTLTLNWTTISAKRSVALGGYFNGTVDDIRLYNRALSSAEVTQLYTYVPGP